ncbi:MAG: hypothetical protein WC872_04650, partial [Candidatus Absconditabacterales bacterium]
MKSKKLFFAMLMIIGSLIYFSSCSSNSKDNPDGNRLNIVIVQATVDKYNINEKQIWIDGQPGKFYTSFSSRQITKEEHNKCDYKEFVFFVPIGTHEIQLRGDIISPPTT